jgi:hypothetical protein
MLKLVKRKCSVTFTGSIIASEESFKTKEPECEVDHRLYFPSKERV